MNSSLAVASAFVFMVNLPACAFESTTYDDINAEAIEDDEISQATAALCSGSAGCDGEDPPTQGCTVGSYPVSQAAVPNGTLYLYWSPNCQTNWARLVRNVKRLNYAWVQRTDGTGKLTTQDIQVSTVMWSNMLWAPGVLVQACAETSDCTGDCGGPFVKTCTAFK